MSAKNFEGQLQALISRLDPLERLVHAWAGRLPAPLRYHSGKQHHGYRYGKPHIEHFCLLKAVRAVSAMNAAIELARAGYTQEIVLLLRTQVEYTTHMEFVVAGRDEAGGFQPAAEKYVQDYFADHARNDSSDFKRAQVRQNVVHQVLGAALDSRAQGSGRDPEKVKAEQLYSDVYRNFSNYVHAKYPETMDLYGGNPGNFHLRGMRATPKDAENLAQIDAAIETASITLMQMVTTFQLHDIVACDTAVADWFRAVCR